MLININLYKYIYQTWKSPKDTIYINPKILKRFHMSSLIIIKAKELIIANDHPVPPLTSTIRLVVEIILSFESSIINK